MTRANHGYRPRPEIVDRMIMWRRLCAEGLKTPEIADRLGISVVALRRSVYRARKEGLADAVIHPSARPVGSGLWFLVSPQARQSRRRRLTRAERADDEWTR